MGIILNQMGLRGNSRYLVHFREKLSQHENKLNVMNLT